MTPEPKPAAASVPQEIASTETVPGAAAGQMPAAGGRPPRPTWLQRAASVFVIVLCLELGLFLLIYPWTDAWSTNYFSWIGPLKVQPVWRQFWNNGFVRGAVSGLGLANIWIAVSEALHMYSGDHTG
jgi:hypothetical protein